MVKANAYGHGAFEVAKALELENADYFGVATVMEAISLREKGIKTPILLFGFFADDEIETLLKNDITLSVFDVDNLENISKIAKKIDKIAKIHIKIDTGMLRLGFKDFESELILKFFSFENIFVEGIFSHFSSADIDTEKTKKQVLIFEKTIKNIQELGYDVPVKHISATAGLMYFKEFNFDMVRAGIGLYGYYPDEKQEKNIEISPAMTVFSTIAQVKELKKSESVSYCGNFTAKQDMKIAVVTIGYADGYFRGNSEKAYFMYKGKKTPILGNICMDMCMIDVSLIENIEKGDRILVFGDGLGANVVADFTNAISYEVLCAISDRVCRIY